MTESCNEPSEVIECVHCHNAIRVYLPGEIVVSDKLENQMTEDHRCKHCGTTMEKKRRDAKRCSGACRAAASRKRKHAELHADLLRRIDDLRRDVERTIGGLG